MALIRKKDIDMKNVILALGILFSLNTFAAEKCDIKKVTQEKVDQGKKAYETNCVICHGASGLGDGAAAAGLSPKPRNLVTGSFVKGSKTSEIYSTVTDGLSGTTMAAFGASISDDDRCAIAQYITSIRKK